MSNLTRIVVMCQAVLIVAKCNVNPEWLGKNGKKEFVLIVAKCNVNQMDIKVLQFTGLVLIVAKCNVNYILYYSFLYAPSY